MPYAYIFALVNSPFWPTLVIVYFVKWSEEMTDNHLIVSFCVSWKWTTIVVI